jgi:Mycobacterium 19 kDa lipoprotein antigen
MHRFMVGVAAAAMAVAALAGCSNSKPSSSSSNTTPAGTAPAAPAVGQAKVTVNHVDQSGLGPIVCDVSDYTADITIKRSGHDMAHVSMAWQQGNPPELQSALLLGIQGTTLHVPQLGYGDAPPGIADPTVKRYGNRFVITGYGWNRVDQHNPFDIDVTCP